MQVEKLLDEGWPSLPTLWRETITKHILGFEGFIRNHKTTFVFRAIHYFWPNYKSDAWTGVFLARLRRECNDDARGFEKSTTAC